MPTPRSALRPSAVRWLCALGVLLVVIQNAWVCDDAFITLRVVDHAWAGRGLVFNDGWRVQVYTHPAWMLLLALAYGIVQSGFGAALVCGVLTSAAALYVAFVRVARGRAAVLVAVALAGSRAFVDYSTSGLENPLTHLVVGLAVWAYLGQRQRGRAFARIAGLTGLAFCCRPDAPLVLAPLALAAAVQAHQRGVSLRALARASLWGLGPLLGWELWSIVYYGAWVPNTALAKLGTGLPRLELCAQGGRYLLDTAIGDRVTMVVLLGGAAWCWTRRHTRPLVLGAALYVAYVVWIGGGFMAGRFLTLPVWVVALGVARRRIGRRPLVLLGAGLLVMSLMGARSPLRTGPASVRAPPPEPRWGIADERAHYAAAASLWAWSPGASLPDHPWRAQGEQGPADGSRVTVFDTMGYYGFFSEPTRHIVDEIALGDPLLARLPPLRRIDWRPGHMARPIPRGYLEALEHDDPSRLHDPAVRELYETLRIVHGGELWSGERWAALWRLHTGSLEAAIDQERYRFASAIHVEARRILPRRKPLRVRDTGLRVEGLTPGQALQIVVEPAVPVELRWQHDGERVTADVHPADETLTVPVPEGADGLHLVPLSMGGVRSLQITVSSPGSAP